MLSREAALRFAEAAATWLEEREPRAWLNQSIFITREGGKYAVHPRKDGVALLEKARLKAATEGLLELEHDITRGIDVVKSTAPIDVPVVVFIEKADGAVDMGVITLSLPFKKKPGLA